MVWMLGLLAALPAAQALPDYDAFLESQAEARPAVYSKQARERIEAGWRSSEEPRLGVPIFFWAPRPEAEATVLSELGLKPEQAARRWLFLYGELYRQSPQQLAQAQLQEVHDLGDGAVVVRFHKVIGGVPVFRDTLNVVMSQGLQLVALTGYLSPHDGPRDFLLAADTAFSVAFEDATGARLSPKQVRGGAAPSAGWERFVLATPDASGPARARKVLFPLPQRLEAAWQLELAVRRPDGHEDAYSYVVSAEDGRLLLRHDLAAHAGYRVWADSAAPFTPWDGPQGNDATPNAAGSVTGFQAPLLPGQLVTVNAVAPVSDPWLPAGATSLSGNNAQVFADLVPPDGYNDALTGNDGGFPLGTFDDGGSDLHVPASAAGVFDYGYDFSQNPDFAPSQRYAGGTSAFFTVNWAHDVLYAHGFDEKAGNGQRDNFSRGGLAGDPMDVAIHAWGGRNNTEMRTPADGAPPRLRAFLFDPDGPSYLYLSNDGGALDGGSLVAGPADFGPQSFDVTAEVARGYDDAGNPWDGCQGLTNADEVSGRIVLFSVPNCPFVVAAANAADAGAVGMLMTSPNQSVVTMGGSSPLALPPSLYIQRDAGFQLGVRLDGGVVELARMVRPFTATKDSALDNSILAHEYTHFLSGRLVGDGNGLLNQQGKSLGEGWSDFFALWMMVRESDGLVASNAQWKGTFAIGSYAASGPGGDGAGNAAYYLGVRRYPYSVDLTRNGLTYKHIQLNQSLPLVPGAPFGINTEIHAAGEVWCEMLWEGFIAMVTSPRYSFSEARERMLSYLVASLKATPVMPTFLEARDALLAVVAAKDPLDLQLWMKAFARRGIGIKATGPARFALDNTPVVEDSGLVGNFLRVTSATVTDTPGYCDKDGVLDSGEQGTLTVKVLNVGAGALSASVVTATTTAPGVTFTNGARLVFPAMGPFVPGTATVGIALAPGAAAPVTIPLTLTVFDPDLTGGSYQLAVTVRANTDEVPAAAEHVEGNVDAWLTRLTPGSPTAVTWEQFFVARETAPGQHAFVGPDVGLRADSDLITPALQVGAGPLTVTFKHAFSFEVTGTRTYDGARLEVSTDDGASWTAVPGAALTPGYNGAVDPMSSASLQGQAAFVGASPGYPALVSQQVDLGTAYAGKKIRLRFLIATDTSGGAPGWTVDDLQVTGITNQPFFDVVKDRGVCVNRPPVVALAADRVVEERSVVDLTPLMLSDPDGDALTQTWTQLSGPTVTLAADSFTAPDVAADTLMKFKLSASDGKLTSEDEIELTVRSVNRPPTVDPGQGGTVKSGGTGALHGSGMDPDGDPLTFSWVQIAGLSVQFSNDRIADTTFTAPEVTTKSMLIFQLTANDGQLNSDQPTVTFTVEPKQGGCGCSGAPDAFGLLALAVSMCVWVRRRPRSASLRSQ